MTNIVTSPVQDFSPIAVATGGTFTPGAAAVLQNNANIINATWNLADTRLTDFQAKIDDLTDLTTGWLASLTMPHVTAGTITAPTPLEPSMTIADTSPTAVYADFATQASNIVTTLVNKFTDFKATYFPDEPATYGAAEAWVHDAITNSTTSAVPAAVKAAIIASAQASILSEKARAVADATESWVGKRHNLPPGALAYHVMRIEQKALDDVSEAVRGVAIKDFDQTYDKIMSSVKLALNNRQVALKAAQEYILAMVQAESTGAQVTGTAYEAQTRMLNSAAGFYGARINAAELALKLSQGAAGIALEAAKANQQADLQPIDFRLKALLSEAQALATICAALTNNVRAGGTSSYNVQIG
jgi:hypothetical protein